jgi:glycosyltransferase involved in cell wall biosynthesis
LATEVISIITPSYNRAQFIQEAIESVMQQDYQSLEHIIVDAGSTDGTRELLDNYHQLNVISEPDQGMYEAINKGILRAKGNIIGLLNSDDLYADGAIQIVAESLKPSTGLGAVVGGVTIFKTDGETRKTMRAISSIQPDEIWKRLTIGSPITNGWFFRQEVFQKIGVFSKEYRYSGDKEFLLRFALSNTPWSPINKTLYHYRQHAGSATIGNLDGRYIERARLRKIVFSEGLSISENFLENVDLPPQARRYIRQWHSDRAYRLSAMALYHRWWSLACQTAWHGFKTNKLWPFVFIRMAIVRFYKLIRDRHSDE